MFYKPDSMPADAATAERVVMGGGGRERFVNIKQQPTMCVRLCLLYEEAAQEKKTKERKKKNTIQLATDPRTNHTHLSHRAHHY